MASRPLTPALVLTALLALTACGDSDTQDDPESPQQTSEGGSTGGGGTDGGSGVQSELPTDETDRKIADQLLDAIRTKPKEGGKLVPNPSEMTIEIETGESGQASSLVRNTGDEAVTLSSVRPLVESSGLEIRDRGCTSGRVLEPQQACAVDVTWTDQTGRDVTTGVTIESDAEQTERISIPLTVTVNEPPKPDTPDCPATSERLCGTSFDVPGQKYGEKHEIEAGFSRAKTWICTRDGRTLTVDKGECEKPVVKKKVEEPERKGATAQQIMQSRRQRLGGGFNGGPGAFNTTKGDPDRTASRRRIESVKGYDRDTFDATDATLPVDRSRILTEDRIIKAVLETPISNVMCSRVTAQVERNVYAPEGTNILIPAGTRFIGECESFATDSSSSGRSFIRWRRFITPDGVSAELNAGTADANGRGGIPGTVRKKWFRKYGLPLAYSAFEAAITYALSDGQSSTTDLESGTTTEEKSAGTLAAEQFSDGARRVGQQLAQELQDVKEVLTVPAGSRFDIVLTQDVYFRSPYEVVTLNGLQYRIDKPKRPDGVYRPERIDDKETVVIDGVTYERVRSNTAGGDQTGNNANTSGNGNGQNPDNLSRGPYYDPAQERALRPSN